MLTSPVFRTLVGAAVLASVALCGCSRIPQGAITSEQYNATTPRVPSTMPYILRTGDVVQVRLFSHPELNDRLPIQPDGRIALQLIGEIEVAGKTLAQVRAILTEKYEAQLKKPSVSISVAEFAKQRIYVGGQVRSPGALNYDPHQTCLQAIMESGGFSREAETSTVVVLRNQGTSTPLFIVVNLQQDIGRPGSRSDLALMPQDIVFVPMSTISQLNQFVEQYITKMIPAQTSVGVFYDLSSKAAL
jgi:protein involved in polysaccharide export with SLBB domain